MFKVFPIHEKMKNETIIELKDVEQITPNWTPADDTSIKKATHNREFKSFPTKNGFSDFISSLSFSIQYVIIDFMKRGLTALIGLFTVIIVVFVVR